MLQNPRIAFNHFIKSINGDNQLYKVSTYVHPFAAVQGAIREMKMKIKLKKKMRMRAEKMKSQGIVKGKLSKIENGDRNSDEKRVENGNENNENNENNIKNENDNNDDDGKDDVSIYSQCDFSWIDIDLSKSHKSSPCDDLNNSSDSDSYASRIGKKDEDNENEEREEREEREDVEDIDHDNEDDSEDEEMEERNCDSNLCRKRKRLRKKSKSDLLSSSSSTSLCSFQIADQYLNQLYELSEEGTYIIVLTQSSLLPLVQLISRKQR